jgi:nicotinamidase-related amidase
MEAPPPTHASGDRCGTALLVIDMLSGWDFPDAQALLRQALRITPRIARLAERCRGAGVPVIYANDNRGRWRSDVHQVVKSALEEDRAGHDRPAAAGARITRALEPRAEDYVVLKPRASAFHATPLELLLQHLGVRRLILTGVSSDQCVLVTAHEAHMREFEVQIPRDCVASPTTPARGGRCSTSATRWVCPRRPRRGCAWRPTGGRQPRAREGPGGAPGPDSRSPLSGARTGTLVQQVLAHRRRIRARGLHGFFELHPGDAEVLEPARDLAVVGQVDRPRRRVFRYAVHAWTRGPGPDALRRAHGCRPARRRPGRPRVGAWPPPASHHHPPALRPRVARRRPGR